MINFLMKLKEHISLYRLCKTYPNNKIWETMRDYRALYKTKGISFQEYKNFRLLTQSEKFRKEFLGVEERRLYLDLLNPIFYHNCSRNKYITHRMFEGTGINTSELFCYYQPEGNLCEGVKDTIIADTIMGVFSILKEKGVDSFVIKPTDSSHGDGVLVVHNVHYLDNDAKLVLFDGREMMLSQILSDRPMLFESVIKQNKQMSSFNESSVNSIRFMTTLYPNGEARLIGGFVKIGRKGKCIDNAGSGGNIDSGIDVETGRLYHVCRFDGWDSIEQIERHPDNGVQLEGVVIDNWETIKQKVLEYQKAFPYCKATGWDIAITDDGPVVVEVNDAWDPTGQYFANKGWKKEIRECYEAWKMTGKSWPNRTPCTLTRQQKERILNS